MTSRTWDRRLQERRAGEILQAHDMIISREELSKKRDSFSSGPVLFASPLILEFSYIVMI